MVVIASTKLVRHFMFVINVMLMLTSNIAIGIDLGTTYSCVSAVRNGRVEIIQNDQGSRTTSSCVAFTEEDGILVGDAAWNQMADNPTNTIYSVKRLMGRRFYELHENDLKYWPFKVKSGYDGNPRIMAKYENTLNQYRPQDISAHVLKHMKEIAEKFLGGTVRDAVISVPAYFNATQREATKQAAQLAELNVLRIINEPTAAAIAYGIDHKLSAGYCNALVFDLGGGTFDVSVVRIEGSSYTVKAVAGRSRLGGDDFDERLVEYCASEFMKEYKLDLMSDPYALRRLRTSCDKAKRTLSFQVNTIVEICHKGKEKRIKISRTLFDILCEDLFATTITVVDQALNEARLSCGTIDDIVLVGGSTRIPKIRQLLSNHFAGKQLMHTINPDEAVAHGAALQAAILSGNNSKLVRGIQLIDITPYNVVVEVVGGYMPNIIRRGTPIPCRSRRNNYTTVDDNQTEITFALYQGESTRTRDNHYLGKLTISDIPPQPRHVPKFDVIMQIDSHGILNISVIDMSTKRKKTARIGYVSDLLTQERSGILRFRCLV